MAETKKTSDECSEAVRDDVPHRRCVLAGMAAVAAGTVLPVSAAHASTAFRRNVGDIVVSVVSDGTLNVPLSFSIPDTPVADVDALFRSHGMPAGDTPVQTNVTLVRAGNERILIDAGSGPNFQPSAGKLSANLEAAEIAPQDITKVVFTHAHADHLWGAIDDFDDGERFPNASYVISAAEWDFWTHPDTPGRVPDWLKGMAIGSARILKKIESKIERRKDGESVAPGLSYVATAGHTPGHMSVMIESGGSRVLVGGDVLANNAVSFARPQWRIGSDFDHDLAVVTRRKLLDRLATDRIPLIGFHLAWPGHGMVERNADTFRFVPV